MYRGVNNLNEDAERIIIIIIIIINIIDIHVKSYLEPDNLLLAESLPYA
jgi:hypothetical protein